MIAKLKGLLDSTGEDWAVIDVNGVGYLVFCSGRTLGQMPGEGEAVTLFVDTHVREDHIHLYGFADAGEREMFRLLLSVQGVGAKVGLAILGALRPDELTQAIAAQDKTVVSRAQGVGPKLATRIVNELKDKVGGMPLAAPSGSSPVAVASPNAVPVEASSEAVSALVNLGYGRTDAFSAVAAATRKTGDGAGVETLIREALVVLAKGS